MNDNIKTTSASKYEHSDLINKIQKLAKSYLPEWNFTTENPDG